jgi:hypothetical protein
MKKIIVSLVSIFLLSQTAQAVLEEKGKNVAMNFLTEIARLSSFKNDAGKAIAYSQVSQMHPGTSAAIAAETYGKLLNNVKTLVATMASSKMHVSETSAVYIQLEHAMRSLDAIHASLQLEVSGGEHGADIKDLSTRLKSGITSVDSLEEKTKSKLAVEEIRGLQTLPEVDKFTLRVSASASPETRRPTILSTTVVLPHGSNGFDPSGSVHTGGTDGNMPHSSGSVHSAPIMPAEEHPEAIEESHFKNSTKFC